MQPPIYSPLSNNYIPKLIHYISGSNDTFLHRLIGSKDGQMANTDLLDGLSSMNITMKQQRDYADTQTEDQISFIIQILFFCYVLLGLTQLINDYLMPCLEKLSDTFNLSQTSTGILVAIGISTPELTTNVLSVLSNNTEMFGYGFGAIVGSGVFDFTMCFGITAIFSNYYHKKAISFNIKALLRDIYIYLLTLGYLVIILQDNIVSLTESLFLTLLWPIYVVYSVKFNSGEDELELDTSINSLKVPFQRAYESFQIHKKGNYHSLDQEDQKDESESSDEELDKLLKQRNKNKKTYSAAINSKIKQFFKKIQSPYRYIFRKTIPYYRAPILSFGIIMIFIFLSIKYTISTVDVIVAMLPVSHTFIGLTIASWGGNISDIMNASIAAKNKKTEFATSSIIGSQIINLQIALGLPWFVNNIFYGPIILADDSVFTSLLVVFIVVLISLCTIISNKLHLTYLLGVQLILIYCCYFVFEFYNSN